MHHFEMVVGPATGLVLGPNDYDCACPRIFDAFHYPLNAISSGVSRVAQQIIHYTEFHPQTNRGAAFVDENHAPSSVLGSWAYRCLSWSSKSGFSVFCGHYLFRHDIALWIGLEIAADANSQRPRRTF